LRGSVFLVLLVPALAALATLLLVWRLHPHSPDLEVEDVGLGSSATLPKADWVYLGGGALMAAGYADHQLRADHFSQVSTVSLAWIPALYAWPMGVG
jgi:hypothetical protein